MVNGVRWNNYRDIVKYSSMLSENLLPIEEKYELNIAQKKIEFIMLALRSTGINFEKYNSIFKEDFKTEFGNCVNELVENKFSNISQDNFSLSEKGFAVADEIVAKYF
ncbi:MAG: hypothetical protein LH629_08580, partial [Ignavibacteria bacterium]|nr:hypothetical protein [Ignavibacteria bacterium]